VAFNDKRKRIEDSLGRLEYLGDGVKELWEARQKAKAREKSTSLRGRRSRGKGRQRRTRGRTGDDGASSSDDDTDTDTDTNNKGNQTTTSRSWYTAVRFPFEASEGDHAAFGHLSATCKFWAGTGGNHLFTFPASMEALLVEMKIHHAYVLGGMVGAYIIHRCQDGLSKKVRTRMR
jgi:hypothetical protein